MSSSPGLRSGPLAMPIERHAVQALLGQHLGGDADLALAAVDDQQVGRRIFAGDDARAAARQRLAHRRVVVAAVRRRDVEAAVFARLHREPVEDHARRDRRLAHRVRDVEALDALRRSAAGPAPACSAASRSSCVAFCASLWRDRERRVLQRHRQPHAALAARVARRSRTCCARLRGQHFGERVVVLGVGHDDRRRHRPLEVVLREERRHDLVDASTPSACCGKNVRSPTCRPPRIITTLTRDQPALGRRGDDVDVAGGRALDELPRLQLLQPRDLVAHARRALELERRARRRPSAPAAAPAPRSVLPCRNSAALCTSSR